MVLVAGCLHAQTVVSAKAGLVSYSLGDVTVDGRGMKVSGTRFAEVKEGSVLRTGRGLAEVLLGPCSALRLGNESSFRLVASSPAHPRVELLGGSAVVEISRIAKDADVALQAEAALVTMARAGLYRVDLSPALVKVFTGRAGFRVDGRDMEVGAGRMWSKAGASIAKFDRLPADELDRWSGRRSVELAEMRAAGGKSREPQADDANSAEFPVYNPPRRTKGQPTDDSLTVFRTGADRLAPSGCVAGR